jgi:hypothetical protein
MLFKYDALGNIYFPTSLNTGVSKLIVDNPEEIGVIDYLPIGQKAYNFDLASDGSCIYKYHPFDYDKFRVKKPTGGIFEVQLDGRFNIDFWIGTDGLIYFASESRGFGNNSSMIHKINVLGEEVVIDTLWSHSDTGIVSNTDWSHRIRRDNSVIFIYSTKGFEFFEETNTVVSISLPIAQSDMIIVNSKDYYYIASETDLYKVSFETHEYVKLLKTGEYEVYSLNVDDNDTVLFSGLRFKDGKMIFAEIDSEGNLTVVDEELDRKATMLQRLN